MRGYFVPRVPMQVGRRPKAEDGLNIRSEGPVTSGEKTVQDVIAAETVRVGGELRQFYASTRDYDPVLRSHCGL